MTTDLCCLIVLALWSFPLAHLPAMARVRAAGPAWGVGNRDQAPEVPAWVSRADRAHRNHVDNLTMYAIAILAVLISGRADATSGAAAVVLLGARIAHGVLYVAGVTMLGLRTLAYTAAFGATLVILSRLW